MVDYPESTTPLAKRHRSIPGRVERFELFDRGFELGNAYTELNDPDEQERRFVEQLSSREGEHFAYDADFVEALRFGMPPADRPRDRRRPDGHGPHGRRVHQGRHPLPPTRERSPG